MKCLSVRQPFAWAILKGIKKVENRSRWPDFDGPILLHTGKIAAMMSGKLANGTPVPSFADLHFGAIVGAANVELNLAIEVVEAYRAGEIRVRWRKGTTTITLPDGEKVSFADHADTSELYKTVANDPFTIGPECILLGDPIEFSTPIPYPGQVGLFNVDEEALPLTSPDRKKLRAFLKRAGGTS